MIRVYCYNEIELYRAMGNAYYHLSLDAKIDLPDYSMVPCNNPKQADWFFVPRDLGPYQRKVGLGETTQMLRRLPHWNTHEKRHFIFMHSDNWLPLGVQCVIFRQSCHRTQKDVRTVSFPPNVDDFQELAYASFRDLPYNITFVGHLYAHTCRIRACQSIASRPDAFISAFRYHWGAYENTDIGHKRRKIFIEGLRKSKFCLAPRGGGLHSFRFFETMSAGRIPIIIADDYELPFENIIDYSQCSFSIPESEAGNLNEHLNNWLSIPIDRLKEYADCARAYWMRYLSKSKWNEMVYRYLIEMA